MEVKGGGFLGRRREGKRNGKGMRIGSYSIVSDCKCHCSISPDANTKLNMNQKFLFWKLTLSVLVYISSILT